MKVLMESTIRLPFWQAWKETRVENATGYLPIRCIKRISFREKMKRLMAKSETQRYVSIDVMDNWPWSNVIRVAFLSGYRGKQLEQESREPQRGFTSWLSELGSNQKVSLS